MWDKYKAHRSDVNWQNYKEIRNSLTATIRKKKSN